MGLYFRYRCSPSCCFPSLLPIMAQRRSSGKGQSLSKEEQLEAVFEEFRTDYTLQTDQATVYFPVALFVTAIPLYLYHSIFGMDVQTNYVLYGVVTVLSSMILTLAYHNIAFWLNARLQPARENAISHKNIKKGAKEDKKKALESVKEKQAAVTTKETMWFSMLYNNALFLFILILLAFFVFKNATAPYNYVLSVSLSSTLLSLFAAA